MFSEEQLTKPKKHKREKFGSELRDTRVKEESPSSIGSFSIIVYEDVNATFKSSLSSDDGNPETKEEVENETEGFVSNIITNMNGNISESATCSDDPDKRERRKHKKHQERTTFDDFLENLSNLQNDGSTNNDNATGSNELPKKTNKHEKDQEVVVYESTHNDLEKKTQNEHNKTDDDINSNINDCDDLIKKKKKHKKEQTTDIDTSYDNVTHVEKKLKKKHKHKSEVENGNNTNIPVETNLNVDLDSNNSLTKKEKKKHKGATSDSQTKSEKKKRKHQNSLDDNGEVATKKQKKTPKQIEEKSDVENSIRGRSMSPSYSILLQDFDNETSTPKKKKKHKHHLPENNETETVQSGEDRDPNISQIQIENTDHVKKRKRNKEKRRNKEASNNGSGEDLPSTNKKFNHIVKQLTKKEQKNLFQYHSQYEFKNTYKRRKSILAQVNSGIEYESNQVSTSTQKSINDANITINELIEESQNESSNVNVSLLSGLNVLVSWEVPPLHLIETRICKYPTEEQKARIRDLNVPIKSGIFSKVEDEIIKKNWGEFCKFHDLEPDPTPFLKFTQTQNVFPIKERLNFVRFLAHGLPDRMLFSVYKRFVRLFNNTKLKSGRFTPAEDKIIIEFMKNINSKKPFAELAKILNRNNLAVEKRCQKLCAQAIQVKWDEENIKRFIKKLKKVKNVSNVEDLKYAIITPNEWKKLSKKMDNIPTAKLRRGWYCTIHPRLFISSTINIDTIKSELVNLLIEREETDWRSINWTEIACEFDGFTSEGLNKLFKNMISYHVPDSLQQVLPDCLEYLKTQVLPKVSFRGKDLKKLDLDVET